MKISVCLIVKNEEDVIARAIECAKKFAYEIIVVDTGSTDKTIQILKNLNIKLFHYKWVDNFSKARNFSFSKASGDYIMWLDADDIILDEDIQKIKSLKSNFDTLMCNYVISYEKDYTPIVQFYRERIVKNNFGFVWKDAIHETMEPKGRIVYSDIKVYHAKLKSNPKRRNLKIFEKMDKKAFTPRQRFYYARELMYNQKYKEAIKEFKKFLSENGYIENQIEAGLNLANCYVSLGCNDDALQALFNTFVLDLPRAEILCKIGDIFIMQNKFNMAIYWLKKCLEITPQTNGAFINLDCYKFIPLINLCVCYSKLGYQEEAYKYHLLSKKEKPTHPSVISNDLFFKSILNLN